MTDYTTVEHVMNEVWTRRLCRGASLTLGWQVHTRWASVTAWRAVGDRWERNDVAFPGEQLETDPESFMRRLDHAISHAVGELRDLTVSEALCAGESRRSTGQRRALRDPRMNAWLDGYRRAGRL